MERKKARMWSKIVRFSVYFSALFLLADCAMFTPKTKYTSGYRRGCSIYKVWQACPLITASGLPGTINPDVSPFHSIHVAGPYNVALRSDRGSKNVMIHGDASVIGRTHAYVKDSVLWIDAEKGYTYSESNLANVDIRMGPLSKIYFDSPGKLIANDIRSTRLMVVANHRARVVLRGVVRNLDVITHEKARVDTSGLAVKKNLSASATGESRVYHYSQPGDRHAYPQPDGAVVRMGGLKLEPVCPKPPCARQPGTLPKDIFEDSAQ